MHGVYVETEGVLAYMAEVGGWGSWLLLNSIFVIENHLSLAECGPYSFLRCCTCAALVRRIHVSFPHSKAAT